MFTCDVSPFQVGEIQVKTQFMMSGYLDEGNNKKFW
jgi:hypothetical protein